MSSAIRPTFSMDLPCSSSVVLEGLFSRLGAGPHELLRTRQFGGGGSSTVVEHDHFVLTVSESQRHFWSPWLNVEVKPRGEGARLFARFSPHPSVWTCFAFSYIGLTTVFLISLCFSAALAQIGSTPWTLAISGGCAALIAALWGASQVGQRLAHEQMDVLRRDIEAAVSSCVEGGSAEPIDATPAVPSPA